MPVKGWGEECENHLKKGLEKEEKVKITTVNYSLPISFSADLCIFPPSHLFFFTLQAYLVAKSFLVEN